MDKYLRESLRHNFTVNILDGGFFGLALGLASFVTVLPLFVSQLTDSAILIGLIPAIHNMGWQLPQLLTANRVARLRRYKPMTIFMTGNERLPFLGLAIVAFFLPSLQREAALVLTFLLLIWQGLGGGFAATAWQSMIAKVIPADRRGTFFGLQSSTANLFASGSALAAGFVLEHFDLPVNFAICFLLAFVSLLVSWGFLAWTREPANPATSVPPNRSSFSSGLITILRRDVNFRWFLIARMLFQLATMASSFYTVYAVRHHGVSVVGAGVMTSVLLGTQIVAAPVMGSIGDRWSHRTVLVVGAGAATFSALIAAWSSSADWFYPAFILAGLANVCAWTITLTMTLDFAADPLERPAYIGLANTLVAPSTVLAPLLGGWLADAAGYPVAFSASCVGGLATALVLYLLVRDPRKP
jgi:MFS family permease